MESGPGRTRPERTPNLLGEVPDAFALKVLGHKVGDITVAADLVISELPPVGNFLYPQVP